MPKLRRLTHETLLDRTGMPIDAPLGLPTKVKPIKLLAAPRTGATGKARRWDQVDARLEQRGNITVLIDARVLAEPGRATGPHAGRGRPYQQGLVDMVNLVGTALRMPLRQRIGFMKTYLPPLGFEGLIPTRNTLSLRGRQVKFTPIKLHRLFKGDGVLCIDGTGLSIKSNAGWRRYKHGGEFKQKWVKLHVGVDSETGAWMALEVTAQDGKGSADVAQGPALIRSAGEAFRASGAGLKTIIADRAYDAAGCYQAARDIGAELLVIPKERTLYGGDPDRDQHKAQIGRVGITRWKRETGYSQRNHAEEAFSVHKHIFGEGLRARKLSGATAEVIYRANLWNLWRQLECAPV